MFFILVFFSFRIVLVWKECIIILFIGYFMFILIIKWFQIIQGLRGFDGGSDLMVLFFLDSILFTVSRI